MRRAKVDRTQPEIVDAFRSAGATVQHLHAVGKGCPDLLIGYRGFNLLVEAKDGSLSPSRRKLTEDQVEWHTAWRGQVAIVTSAEDALKWLGVLG